MGEDSLSVAGDEPAQTMTGEECAGCGGGVPGVSGGGCVGWGDGEEEVEKMIQENI